MLPLLRQGGLDLRLKIQVGVGPDPLSNYAVVDLMVKDGSIIGGGVPRRVGGDVLPHLEAAAHFL